MKKYDPEDYSPYNTGSGNWVTCLSVHGPGLDRDHISQRLGLPHDDTAPVAAFLNHSSEERQERGGVAVKIYESRINDLRMLASAKETPPERRSGFWAYCLTARQVESTHGALERYLEQWLDLVSRYRSVFAEFPQQGYWTVLDCIAVVHDPSAGPVQFRLPANLLAQLGRLGIDVDFTIADIKALYKPEIAAGLVVF